MMKKGPTWDGIRQKKAKFKKMSTGRDGEKRGDRPLLTICTPMMYGVLLCK